MASGDVVPVPAEDSLLDIAPADPAPVEEAPAEDPVAGPAKPKAEKKAKEPKEKKPRKPRAAPAHPPYAEVCYLFFPLSSVFLCCQTWIESRQTLFKRE